MEDLPVGLLVARAPDGELVYANRMFADLMGSASAPCDILTRDGEPYPAGRLPFAAVLEQRRVVVVDDMMLRRSDETLTYARAVATPMFDGDAITHVAICWFDMNAEQAKLEREHRQYRAQRHDAISTLAGGIAHDFNNLIFGIKLLAAELSAGEVDDDRRSSLEMIDEITERAVLLTRSLLTFAGRGKHRALPVALDDVIGGMRDMLSGMLSGAELTFELDAPDRGSVIGDHSQLEQVVMNLVVNARENGGKRLVVRTSRERGHVVLEVADDGPGIDPELRERVFEPYYTTKTNSSHRGTGLGLATVFGIVERHKGTIDIGTGLDGAGATLRVKLPAAPEPAEESQVMDDTALEAGTGSILVVDDDLLVRRAVAMTLRGLGYTTYEAANGNEAVELYRRHHDAIRAVVLDVIMPGMSGRATYAAMREVDPAVTVLLMSGYTKNEDVQRLLEQGARGFMMKPYSVEVLARSLADAIKTPIAVS